MPLLQRDETLFHTVVYISHQMDILFGLLRSYIILLPATCKRVIFTILACLPPPPFPNLNLTNQNH